MRLKTIRTPLAAAAALFATALMSTVAVAPAHAEEPESVSGDVVAVPGLELRGRFAEERYDVWANVLGLKPHGGEETLVVYCIDIHTPLDTENPYAEGAWEESGVENLEEVRWVLLSGFPNVGAEELIEVAGAAVNPDWSDEEVAEVAYAGTQAAVWHFTDGWDLLEDDPVKGGNDGKDDAVLAVYDHLTEESGRVPDPSEFTVDLEGEEAATFEDGRFGPYTLRSNAGPVELSAEGGKLETENGEAVESLKDGEQFWIVLDEGANEITVDGTASYDLPVGRVFMAHNDEALTGDPADPFSYGDSQQLILAEAREGEVPAEWRFALDAPEASTPPKPQLPVTGSSLSIAFAAGLALLVGGMTVIVFAKRGGKVSDH
jgi:TQXA domain-containing protein